MDFRITGPSVLVGMVTSQAVVRPAETGPGSVSATDHVSVHSKAPEPKAPTLIEQIRDKGMQAYVKELEEKKKEELRQKILQEMGLSEEALNKMSPDARSAIEKMIAQEIAQRMAAESQLEAEQKGQKGLSKMDALGQKPGGPHMAKIDAAGVGLGPLLALQEADAARQDPSHALKDADEKTG